MSDYAALAVALAEYLSDIRTRLAELDHEYSGKMLPLSAVKEWDRLVEEMGDVERVRRHVEDRLRESASLAPPKAEA